MKRLIHESELRDEILKSVEERNDRRIILLSIDIQILVYLLSKFDFQLNVFFELEEEIDEKQIQSLIIYNFSKEELLDSLYLKSEYEDINDFYPKDNIELELNSFNSNNDCILFKLLETNQLVTLTLLFEGMGIWNSFSLFVRNMNNEVFILTLYSEYNKELLEFSMKEIFFGMNDSDINVRNENGDTFLHLAVRKYDEEMVNFLLLNGADPYLKNHAGSGIFENTDIEFWKEEIELFSIEVQ